MRMCSPVAFVDAFGRNQEHTGSSDPDWREINDARLSAWENETFKRQAVASL